MKSEEIEEEIEPWYKGPIRWMLALFLLLIIVLWAIPFTSIKLDPGPSYIPSIEEVFPSGNEIGNGNISIENIYDYVRLVKPNDPIIKNAATKIASLSCKQGKICHAKAIYYFVRDNFRYVADPVNEEYLEEPITFVRNGGGDCESGTLLLASLMSAVGIESQLVLIAGHAYLKINVEDASKRYEREGWIYLDWTCKNCEFGEIPLENIGKDERYIGVS
ncbi:MAG: transglutaminase domain-containing protein [Nanoarchaeota archaeon]|nr:transglutaminase domain-containing protein [Nanoarchaeota archaeon]